MKKLTTTICLTIAVLFGSGCAQNVAQTLLLQANGSQNAYNVINDKLANFNGNVIETPDCSHSDFGPHITQVYDAFLKKHVFRFHIHRDQDTDRCVKFDRQRTEIKVYDKSPDWLKATENSKFIYQWKFKIDKKFQSSKKFTHFFQLKGVGLPYGMPLMTLTARKGASEDLNRFEIRHAAQRKSNTIKVQKLQPFLGKWLQVNVEVNFGNKGKLVIQITSMKDSNRLLHYESNSIKMWKDYADFIRPKWGIYRSLKYKDALRDEAIYFADIVIRVN